MLMGCWTLCGLRVRMNLEKNKVLRININPYHPLSSDHYLDYNQSILNKQVKRLKVKMAYNNVLLLVPVENYCIFRWDK